ncbi:indole-3-glycerol phosphate synthase TrpC [Acinetobacter qingfengensis]|uniref:Indole-3-glycerol phosphate synthase n=1 Tax=Acinetobacter qingfengensis TaxID=1262585 RepID=A0A1E7RCB9_9GAMM|nr:indole-3-glycerol phosphate synthase TrpC [Acinetobacter qingfengensis]KAA8735243.1 indole-3-glycerol phosphate synthase TrpC [Acinetobacter qingfengensis]OEY96981.1 indole-3-glycerol phosphate synthase [Acinetobacter qingfengensis]
MQKHLQDTILGKIVLRKYEEIAAKQKQYSLADLEQLAQQATPVRGFAQALQHKSPAIIAEIKKASPSKGIIRENFQPAEIAQQYEQAGAACLSVLTDVDFFQGHHDNIRIAREACTLPALRKDFMVDPYHIIESRALQADCILLIVAALSDAQLQELAATAFEQQLDVLVEVHDEQEMQRALQLPEQCLLGVNNRNLKTFAVDLNTTVRLKDMAGSSRQIITESGISTSEQVQFMQDHGIDRFLVGEGFMKQPHAGQALHTLFGLPRTI